MGKEYTINEIYLSMNSILLLFRSISLWRVSKKKPLTSYPNAHGVGSSESNWITSLAVLRNTDLIASGTKYYFS